MPNPHPQTENLKPNYSKWHHKPVKTIRVPEIFTEQIINYARQLDRDEPVPIYKFHDIDVEAIFKKSRFSRPGFSSVYLEDFYEILELVGIPCRRLRDLFREIGQRRQEYIKQEGLLTLGKATRALELHFKEGQLAESKGFLQDYAVPVKRFPSDCLFYIPQKYELEGRDYNLKNLNDLIYYKPPLSLTQAQLQHLKDRVNLTNRQACEFFSIKPSNPHSARQNVVRTAPPTVVSI